MRRDLEKRVVALETARQTLYTACPEVLKLSDDEIEAEVLRILGDDLIETPAGSSSWKETAPASPSRCAAPTPISSGEQPRHFGRMSPASVAAGSHSS